VMECRKKRTNRRLKKLLSLMVPATVRSSNHDAKVPTNGLESGLAAQKWTHDNSQSETLDVIVRWQNRIQKRRNSVLHQPTKITCRRWLLRTV
jgi:hypothetical protein